MNGFFTIERPIYESLNPKQRFMYTEICSLVVFKPEGLWHEEYKRLIPQGGWVISYRQLAKRLGFTVPTTHRIAHELAKKNILTLQSLGKISGRDGLQERIMFYMKQPMEHSPVSNESLPDNELEGSKNEQWNIDLNEKKKQKKKSSRFLF